jgi:dimethylhistidine N-methyltransferase
MATTPALEKPENFARDILTGLRSAQKTIHCKYFYDAVGSALFEQITALPEYYPTRTEIDILSTCATDIASRTIPGTVLVEFGSGSSIKTDILLAACPAITHYVPIDVSPTALAGAAARLAAKFPALTVSSVVGDFAGHVDMPETLDGAARLGFFPGSTIGNFSHAAAVTLLASFRRLLGDGARLIIGADLRKSAAILIPAYNDDAGITAAFNLNLLARINRELNGTFDLAQFAHDATYDVAAGRIDMWLVSLRRQTVTIDEIQIEFAAGERIHTEISQKYAIDELQDLAKRAGWQAQAGWTDTNQLFSVHEFASAQGPIA